MFVNKVTKLLLVLVTIVTTPLKWVMIVPTAILLHTPLINTVYQFLVMAAWLPFGVLISGIGWLYAHIPIIGYLLAVIGIPVVLVGYIVGLLMSPSDREERNFVEICNSYPFSTTVI